MRLLGASTWIGDHSYLYGSCFIKCSSTLPNHNLMLLKSQRCVIHSFAHTRKIQHNNWTSSLIEFHNPCAPYHNGVTSFFLLIKNFKKKKERRKRANLSHINKKNPNRYIHQQILSLWLHSSWWFFLDYFSRGQTWYSQDALLVGNYLVHWFGTVP